MSWYGLFGIPHFSISLDSYAHCYLETKYSNCSWRECAVVKLRATPFRILFVISLHLHDTALVDDIDRGHGTPSLLTPYTARIPTLWIVIIGGG